MCRGKRLGKERKLESGDGTTFTSYPRGTVKSQAIHSLQPKGQQTLFTTYVCMYTRCENKASTSHVYFHFRLFAYLNLGVVNGRLPRKKKIPDKLCDYLPEITQPATECSLASTVQVTMVMNQVSELHSELRSNSSDKVLPVRWPIQQGLKHFGILRYFGTLPCKEQPEDRTLPACHSGVVVELDQLSAKM